MAGIEGFFGPLKYYRLHTLHPEQVSPEHREVSGCSCMMGVWLWDVEPHVNKRFTQAGPRIGSVIKHN